MGTHLSTDCVAPKQRTEFWQDLVCDTFVSLDCVPQGCRDLAGEIATERGGDLVFSTVTSVGQRVDRTPARIRRMDGEVVLASLQLEGRGEVLQGGRAAPLWPGDMALYDSRYPYTLSFSKPFRQLVVQVPRQEMEIWLPDLRCCTAIRFGISTAAGRLVSGYLADLARTLPQLDEDSAARMSRVALDLMVVGLSERLACQPPNGAAGAMLVQRAKQLIERRLSDPDLDLAAVAAGVGVSLRTLQAHFQAHGLSVSGWLWERRLKRAHRQLTDPALAVTSIGAIAVACGFRSQGHFSRRYRAAYGVSPRAARAQAVAGLSTR